MPDLVADPVGAAVAILKAATPQPGALAGRVYGAELPIEEAEQQPRGAIVIRASGGVSLTGASDAEHDTVRLDLFAYGPTPKVAADLCSWAALQFRRAQRVKAAHTLVHWIRPAGGYSSAREPETEWPRAFQSFQVFHALESVL